MGAWFAPIALALSFLAASLALVIETVLYLARVGWYYRLGPPLHREVWQTAVSPTVARERCIERSRFRGYRPGVRGDSVCVRCKWTKVSAWPRFVLRIEEREGIAELVYEARPFITMAPFVLIFSLAAIVGMGHVWHTALRLLIAAAYVFYWRRELRQMARLAPLRQFLGDIGLQICTRCGYDLHTRAPDAACPECGSVPKAVAALAGRNAPRNGPSGDGA